MKLFLLSLIFVFCANIQAKDFKSPDVQAKVIKKMRDLSNQEHAKSIHSASNYDKAIFDAVQRGYGGYNDIQVKFDDKDPNLSKSEKASIENTRRNSEITKNLMQGFK